MAKVEFDKDGNAIEGLGTVQDITERKRAESEIRTLNAELEPRWRLRTWRLWGDFRATARLQSTLAIFGV
jgi:hypothetical protein